MCDAEDTRVERADVAKRQEVPSEVLALCNAGLRAEEQATGMESDYDDADSICKIVVPGTA